MRKFPFLVAASIALVAASCSTSEETEVAVEPVTYSLDAATSTLSWKGSMSPEYFHTGTVSFKEGSITMEGDSLTAGSFVVDMKSLQTTDADKEKGAFLIGHLQGTMVDEDHPQDLFFNTPKFPTVQVKLGAYADGKLTTTLMILGSELTQDVPVKITADDKGASIKGKFSMDFTSLNIPGLQKDDKGQGISPMIEFDLNLMLKK